jgi:hypothetical protein
MSQDQEISYGTKLEYKPSGSFVEIAEVYDISGPGYERKSIVLRALRDAVARKKLGRLNVGPVSLKLGYNKNNYDIFVLAIKGNTSYEYRLTGPEGSTEVFNARLTNLSKTYQDEEGIVFDVTLDVDGDTTWTKA